MVPVIPVTVTRIAATTTCAPGAAASPKIGDLKSAEAMRGESGEQGREGRRVERERERERKNKRASGGKELEAFTGPQRLGPALRGEPETCKCIPLLGRCCSGVDCQNS